MSRRGSERESVELMWDCRKVLRERVETRRASLGLGREEVRLGRGIEVWCVVNWEGETRSDVMFCRVGEKF